jgi:hypothetical protein
VLQVKRRCSKSETGHSESIPMTVAELVKEVERVTASMDGFEVQQ